jgi:hypothetical protein
MVEPFPAKAHCTKGLSNAITELIKEALMHRGVAKYIMLFHVAIWQCKTAGSMAQKKAI